MHELALAENIIKTIKDKIKSCNVKKIRKINLIVGELSCVSEESLTLYWDIMSKDTICEFSVLNFKKVPAIMKCNSCCQTFSMSKAKDFRCPLCNGDASIENQAKDFYIESIEIEP